MSRSYVVLFLFFNLVSGGVAQGAGIAHSGTKVDVEGKIAAVQLDPANNFVIFGDLTLSAYVGSRWAFNADYFRNIGLSPDIGQFIAGSAKIKYFLKSGEWLKDSLFGFSAAYQVYNLNFGTLPELGLGIFAAKPISKEFLLGFDYPTYFNMDVSYYFSSLDDSYTIGPIFNIDGGVRFEAYPCLYPVMGLSYRKLQYQRVGTSGDPHVISYLAFSLGMAYSY